MNSVTFRLARFVCVSLVVCTCRPLAAQDAAPQSVAEIVVREGLVLPITGQPRRTSLPTSELESRWVRGAWQSPQEGDEVTVRGDEVRTWKRIQAADDGWLADRALAGGLLVARVEAPADEVWLLDARGHNMVRVNGEPRTGDVYANGSVELPVKLRQGTNELVFSGARGRIWARLHPPSKPLFLSLRDTTFPTPVRGEEESLWGSVLLVNATTDTVTGLELRSHGETLAPITTPVPAIPPLSTRKVAFRVQPPSDLPPGDLAIQLQLGRAGTEEPVDSAALAWSVRDPHERQRRTFISAIDGSVQYYALTPPAQRPTEGPPPAMYLTLHGAGVEGDGQAGVYAPKPNGYVVAPTNRRAFGFDWEDWGRLDALEVLNLASARFSTDPRRTYLTGHSMGGHGTWHIGSLFPDRFAAIGPSAGWISFATYAGGRTPASERPLDQLLARTFLPSDTLSRVSNLATQGVYILHGDQDDNVPVGQARAMREQLAKFHPDFVYKEQPGAGHWWGNACCDWPPLFAFFADHQLPGREQVQRVSFVTSNPAISAHCHWATIAAQQQFCAVSRIDLQLDRKARRFSGTTDNVVHLALDVTHLAAADGEPDQFQIELDGTTLESIPRPSVGRIWLERSEGKWRVIDPPPATVKGPHRYGPFKEAFQHRFLLVYGTHGSDDENAWMLAKARLDAETFWYRGNGSVDVVADTVFRADREPDRSVIVYGNSEVNAAWKSLLEGSPIQVARDRLQAGELDSGEDPLMALFIRPRSGSDHALVAAIGGTNLTAMRATTRLPIFVSGTGYPDALIASPDYLLQGVAAVRLAGYFGLDWSLERGEWAKGEN